VIKRGNSSNSTPAREEGKLKHKSGYPLGRNSRATWVCSTFRWSGATKFCCCEFSNSSYLEFYEVSRSPVKDIF
jgi:hypothetical protein